MKKASQFTVQRGWKIMLTDVGLNPAHVLALAGLPADLFPRSEPTLSPNDRLQFGISRMLSSLQEMKDPGSEIRIVDSEKNASLVISQIKCNL